MNPRVVAVTVLERHRLRVLFANGEHRIFDVTPYLSYPAYKRLVSSSYFALAQPDHGTVVWPDDVDFCPDTIYVESVREVPEIYAAEEINRSVTD